MQASRVRPARIKLPTGLGGCIAVNRFLLNSFHPILARVNPCTKPFTSTKLGLKTAEDYWRSEQFTDSLLPVRLDREEHRDVQIPTQCLSPPENVVNLGCR